MDEVDKYKRRLAREKMARQQAEDLLEVKAADLFEKNRELISLSDGLEKLVAQRTAQMQKARDEALTALQVKSDFIANMSHELRTPMNGVLGILSLLLDEDLNTNQKELLGIAQASGEHLLMVINDVLDFSKIEANKIELVLAPVEMRSYIKSVCKTFEMQAQQKNISFEYYINDNVPNSLIIDKLRLTQIITNLLSNAVKFTQQGSVCLHFEQTSSGNNDQYKLTVTDTGIGISKENLNTVFSAFEQADTSITREFGGTGLGMNITKRLVDMFSGTISLESELGKGTTFCIEIAFEQGEESVPAEAFANKASNTGNSSGGNILLVEDNKINQLVAKRMLENWGLQVVVAENGQEAIDMLENNAFDLIFMDLQMPIKGGIEATIEIRKHGLVSETTPIIAMTAHSNQSHIDECIEAGMQAHMSKPIDKKLLQEIVETYLYKVESTEPEQEHTTTIAIDGVDVNDGLARLNGDWQLLHTLIDSFLKEHAGLGERIHNLLQQKDTLDAQSLLHRVKGSGSNLGLVALAKLAGAAETKLKNETTLNKHEIDDIDTAFEAVATGFAKVDVPAATEQADSSRVESHAYMLEKMGDILLNLNKDMLASEDALADLLACVLPVNTQTHINNAHSAMQQFNMPDVEKEILLAKSSLQES